MRWLIIQVFGRTERGRRELRVLNGVQQEDAAAHRLGSGNARKKPRGVRESVPLRPVTCVCTGPSANQSIPICSATHRGALAPYIYAVCWRTQRHTLLSSPAHDLATASKHLV
eukprot:scaffold12195_cov164-Isochrysis_galbana.AAC.5